MEHNNYNNVFNFNDVFGNIVKNEPDYSLEELNKKQFDEIIKPRYNLIEEELQELNDAMNQENKIEIQDALADLLFVIHGLGSRAGIKLFGNLKEVINYINQLNTKNEIKNYFNQNDEENLIDQNDYIKLLNDFKIEQYINIKNDDNVIHKYNLFFTEEIKTRMNIYKEILFDTANPQLFKNNIEQELKKLFDEKIKKYNDGQFHAFNIMLLNDIKKEHYLNSMIQKLKDLLFFDVNFNLHELQKLLQFIIICLYKISNIKYGYDLDIISKIVYDSNMTKFCINEDEALKTIEFYNTTQTRYTQPIYKKVNNYYIIYNSNEAKDEYKGKILKSINYKPAIFI